MIRLRIDGQCREYQRIPGAYRRALAARLKIMAQLDIAERRKPQDGKIKFRLPDGRDLELRVATLPTQGGNEDVVMRLLAANEPIPMDKLGFVERNLREVRAAAEKPYGLILVVGPTGSGKTTTLHSVLAHINQPERKIWTAEDPVEITQYGLRQVQVQPKIGFTFAAAMRSFLRADPDVIMVGEMRDEETAATGIEASLTGHLVFSTLHTNSAVETVVRLLDMGLDPFNFADALLAIVAQRLVRRICTDCLEQYHPEQEEFEEMVHAYGADDFQKLNVNYDDDLLFHRGKGCAVLQQHRIPRARGHPRGAGRHRPDEEAHPVQGARGRDGQGRQGRGDDDARAGRCAQVARRADGPQASQGRRPQVAPPQSRLSRSPSV